VRSERGINDDDDDDDDDDNNNNNNNNGRETWALTLREGPRLRVFGNRVLRIFGHKREEVAGGWRRPHKEGLHNLYASPNIIGGHEIEDDDMGGTCNNTPSWRCA
jgi:hypothetical protein